MSATSEPRSLAVREKSRSSPSLSTPQVVALWVLLGITLILTGLTLLPPADASDVLSLPMPLAFAGMGALLISRRSGNRIGWILLVAGVAAPLGFVSYGYSTLSFSHRPGPLPLGGLAAWTANFILGAHLIFLVMALLFLIFPDGLLPSPRWRWLVWTGAFVYGLLAITAALWSVDVTGLYPGRSLHSLLPGQSLVLAIAQPFLIIQLGVVAASAVALVVRFRRSKGEERQQLKWFAFTVVAVVVATVLSIAIVGDGRYSFFFFSFVPIAIAVAILKYRLYDIDVVINKTVVFGALAAFITAVYVAIVVGIGNAIGSGGRPNLGLSILATAIVAVAFQPVRARVQHFANRLVYGKRATPYEVLSNFSDRVAQTYATEDVLPRMAQTIQESTGAEWADVWLRSVGEMRLAASWPEVDHSEPASIPVNGEELPVFSGYDKAIAVRHQGELLGALTVKKSPGEPLSPGEEKLLADLAAQAGLVLRNVGLTSELLQRLDELTASRQRLVAAQDQERRRLERDLHDGAQQHLVALQTRLTLAERLTDRDPAKAEQMITSLEAAADEALNTLRDLARGIYPPVLAEQGLAAALEIQAQKAPVEVEVQAADLPRYPQEVEAAVYFCCLEALQNVAKYAKATHATIKLADEEGALSFAVSDDGKGFDSETITYGSGLQNMSDRLAAIDGSLSVNSTPHRGTTIEGCVPVGKLETVA